MERIQKELLPNLAARFQQYSDESNEMFSLFSKGLFPSELKEVSESDSVKRRCFPKSSKTKIFRFEC